MSEKVCESTYLAATNPELNAMIHGAAMVDRSSGQTHFYMVRGACTESVVGELEKQLVKAGKIRSAARRGSVTTGPLAVIGMVALGIVGLLLAAVSAR